MALPPLQDLLDLLADNTAGDISATDLQDIVTALYEGIETSGGGGGGGSIPVGGLLVYSNDDTPTGFFDCDGALVSRITYAALFAKIGIKYGAGDGVSTFQLPDYRGRFLRVQDDGAGIDPDAGSRTDRGDGTIGDAVGTKQDGAFTAHDHYNGIVDDSTNAQRLNAYAVTNDELPGLATHHPQQPAGSGSVQRQGRTSITSAPLGASETRPINAYVRILIRYEELATSFTSGSIPLTAGSKAIAPQAHGLSSIPRGLYANLVCNITDLNYVANDRIDLKGLRWDGTDNNGLELSADATNITAIQINDIQVLNKTTFALSIIDYAKWSLVLRASL
jgi:microcystin-dependent protein